MRENLLFEASFLIEFPGSDSKSDDAYMAITAFSFYKFPVRSFTFYSV